MAGKPDSTGGPSPQGEAVRAVAEVGGVRSSADPMPDLWWSGERLGERRDATCSAGVKRKEGGGDGPAGLTAPDKVRQLQITLYRKAQAQPAYRFWSLYGEVLRTDVLAEAWRRVRQHGGAPGVDGVTIEALSAGPEKEAAWLSTLQGELRLKTYRPAPVRRVLIPKASGGMRQLGIPTVQDRVVQMAAYLVLMPIFEADFHPCSFGFRPGKSAHQAVQTIRTGLRQGRTEVVDADLAQYFDTIPHQRLLRQVARRVSDGAILKLLKAWLRAPILEEDGTGGRRLKSNSCGTPQGGVISPLLANLYLHPLDAAVNQGPERQMVRYADDLVILCRPGTGLEMKARLARWLQSRGLALNEAKTQVLQSRASGFRFLGFSFRWQKSRGGGAYVHVEPSPSAEQALRDRVRQMTRRWTTGEDVHRLVQELNPVLRGWEGYFAVHQHYRSFQQLNHFITQRLRRWLRRKHGQSTGMYRRWPDAVLFQHYGLHQLRFHFS